MTVVRLVSASPAQREEIAIAVRDLLLAREVVVPSDRRDSLWQPNEWKPGPAARVSVEGSTGSTHSSPRPTTVSTSAAIANVYHPVENDEAPRCPHCAAAAPADYADSYGDWLEEWMAAGREPTFACDKCGWSGLVGDWTGQFSVLIGAPAVTVPQLAAASALPDHGHPLHSRRSCRSSCQPLVSGAPAVFAAGSYVETPFPASPASGCRRRSDGGAHGTAAHPSSSAADRLVMPRRATFILLSRRDAGVIPMGLELTSARTNFEADAVVGSVRQADHVLSGSSGRSRDVE